MSFIGSGLHEIIEKICCPSSLFQFHRFGEAGRRKIAVVHLRFLCLWALDLSAHRAFLEVLSRGLLEGLRIWGKSRSEAFTPVTA